MSIILLMVLLQIKHFVCDFPLQKPYQYLNKGKYLHPGGLLHAGVHALATMGILSLWNFGMAALCCIIDFLVHYHIDWAKVNINNHYGWKADNSEKFWILLGLDQLLHQLTYVGFIWLL